MRFTAAIIDVFRRRNNSHNTDLFFTTLTGDKNETDPVAQILTRRVLQIMRHACKKKGAADKYKHMGEEVCGNTKPCM